jgi:hypothetical protein
MNNKTKRTGTDRELLWVFGIFGIAFCMLTLSICGENDCWPCDDF